MLVGARDAAHAHDPRHVRARPARATCSARPASTGPVGQREPAQPALLARERRRHGREHARPADRLGLPAPGERQPLQRGPRDAGRDVSRARAGQHPERRATAASATRSCPSPRAPQLTFPSIQDGVLVPGAPGHRPGPLPGHRHLSLRPRAPTRLRARGRGAAREGGLRPRRLPGRPRRDGPGLRRTSTTTATAGSTTTTCSSR